MSFFSAKSDLMRLNNNDTLLEFKSQPQAEYNFKHTSHKSQNPSQVKLLTYLAAVAKNISKSSKQDVKSPAMMRTDLPAAFSLMKRKLVCTVKLNDLFCMPLKIRIINHSLSWLYFERSCSL